MSTVAMRVDLDCEKCFKKIRKAICKIQDKVSVRTISYDEKSKTVTVSGPFDADEVADRLASSAGKVITDMHVAGGGNGQRRVVDVPGKKKGDGHGHGAYGGGGGHKQEKGHGGFGFGGGGNNNMQEKGRGGFGFGGGNANKQEKGHGGFGFGGGGNKQDVKSVVGHGGFGGGGGGVNKHEGKGHGTPDKKHVKFDFDDMSDDDDDDFDDLPPHAHHGGKPKIVTSTPVAARLDAPRTGPSMSMAPAAPMPRMMPGMMAPHPQPRPQPQALATPSIWPAPAAPDWGHYSAPQYGGPPAGGYGHGGYGAAPAYGYGYGGNPYGAPPTPPYYGEEPGAGCSVM